MHTYYEAEPHRVCELGLRLKSPAHIHDFFAAPAGVKGELIHLRRMLRDESAAIALPALRRDPHMEAAALNASGCDGDSGGGSEIYSGGGCCRDSAGKSKGLLALSIGGQRWVCTNTVCSDYVPQASKDVKSCCPKCYANSVS